MAGSSLFNSTEDDLFFFESDHLALRGNKDYCDVLKTVVVLTAQREKLLKDYKKVLDIRKNVIDDFDNVLQKLQNGEDLGIELPSLIDLPKLPVINFEKYNVKLPKGELKSIYENNTSTTFEYELKKEQEKRKTDGNQMWTVDEQKKLEELLLKYPPEAIERRRYKKIAKELGNKSVSQVASRIQKYFLKLYKAGLPIPGRIPKATEKHRRSFVHKHQRYNEYLHKPSTFFPEFNPPVVMNEMDSVPGPSSDVNIPKNNCTNYLIQTDYHEIKEITGISESELEIQLLKRIKQEKLREEENGNDYQHIGYKCDYCNSDPIIGTRWHCALCSNSVDFCTDCLISQMYSKSSHPVTHPMVICINEHQQSFSHEAIINNENMKIKEEVSSDSYDSDNVKKEDDDDDDQDSMTNFD